MNQIKILLVIAIIIQSTLCKLVLLNEDGENGESKIAICIDICFECFSIEAGANKPNEV